MNFYPNGNFDAAIGSMVMVMPHFQANNIVALPKKLTKSVLGGQVKIHRPQRSSIPAGPKRKLHIPILSTGAITEMNK